VLLVQEALITTLGPLVAIVITGITGVIQEET